MEYILILLMGILASSKMSFQTAFSKRNVKNSMDAICFNIFVFITATIIFIPKIFGCSPAVWIYATISAICTVAYQLFYTKALSIGNVSMTVIIVNFGMVINVLVSYLFFDEPVSFIRLIAICMTVMSFIICNVGKKTNGVELKWLIFTLLSMVTSSGGSIVQKFLGESRYSGENQAYVSCLYLVATVISIIIFLIVRNKEKRSFKIGFATIKYAVMVGLTLGLYQAVFTYGLAHIDGTFLFPAQTGATIVLSTISGMVIFKDKFTKKQLIGSILGIISLVLMSF